jgi:hypothetical protein
MPTRVNVGLAVSESLLTETARDWIVGVIDSVSKQITGSIQFRRIFRYPFIDFTQIQTCWLAWMMFVYLFLYIHIVSEKQ